MINYIYQLVNPRAFSIKYSNINLRDKVIVRPEYMAVCHADQRYYLGQRDMGVMRKKLPMALIHECCGSVVDDPTGTYQIGQPVVLIPNVPPLRLEEGIYENYAEGSFFMSSGHDGFMRELVEMTPERIVPFNNIEHTVAAITEFVSVGIHAITRFTSALNGRGKNIGLWGDGSLSYVVSCSIKRLFPNFNITIIGKDRMKLSQFMFANNTFLLDSIPNDFEIDHAFECAGGEGSYYAIDDIIKYIRPQGTVMLMGVSENKIAVNTRDVLEKGLTLIGSSRSGKKDFEDAVRIMEEPDFQQRLGNIITEDDEVRCIQDIHRVFNTDLNTPFKTVFRWNM